jgi:predicted transposase YbfD/YdcC
MPSLEAKLEGLLTEVKGLNEALDDEVKERRRDHDKLTELLTKYASVTELFDGFIDERTFDRKRLDELRRELDGLERRLKPVEDYKNAREESSKSARIREFNDIKEKRKMRWDLVVALLVGLLCALAGVVFTKWLDPKEKPAVGQVAPSKP